MATLKDVAWEVGLSVTQTSRALNDHSDVSEATRARVKQAARALQYRPNLSARKLVSGRSGMVGLVTPRTRDLATDSLFMEVVAGLSMEFSELEMQFVLHIAREDEPVIPVYQRLIGNGALDGFVLIHPTDDDPRAAFLTQAEIPFIVHGRIGAGFIHERDIQHDDGRIRMTGHKTRAVGGNQRMHDPFEPLKPQRVRGQCPAQRGAVDAAAPFGARKGRRHRGDRTAPGRVKFMHRRIRVPDRMAKLAKHLCGGRLAHADPAGQAQPKAHPRTA